MQSNGLVHALRSIGYVIFPLDIQILARAFFINPELQKAKSIEFKFVLARTFITVLFSSFTLSGSAVGYDGQKSLFFLAQFFLVFFASTALSSYVI